MTISLFHQFTASPVWARRALTTGQAGDAFMLIPVSARAAALGEAFAGFGDDAAALEYNPGAVPALPKRHLAVSRIEYFQGAAFSAADLAGAFGRFGAGVSYRQFTADDEIRDGAGADQGDIAHRDGAAGVVLGRRFGRKLSVGIGAKTIFRKISFSGTPGVANSDVTRNVWAGDVGLLYALPGRGTLGVAVQNIGAGGRFEFSGSVANSPFDNSTRGRREALPLLLRIGGAHPVQRLVFSWEMMQPRDNRVRGAAGVEAQIAKIFFLRGGMRFQKFLDVSAGLGAAKGPLSFDYAFTPRVDIGNAHRMTFGVRF